MRQTEEEAELSIRNKIPGVNLRSYGTEACPGEGSSIQLSGEPLGCAH